MTVLVCKLDWAQWRVQNLLIKWIVMELGIHLWGFLFWGWLSTSIWQYKQLMENSKQTREKGLNKMFITQTGDENIWTTPMWIIWSTENKYSNWKKPVNLCLTPLMFNSVIKWPTKSNFFRHFWKTRNNFLMSQNFWKQAYPLDPLPHTPHSIYLTG